MRDVIALSDLHINSTVALCKPVVNLDDGGTYHASKAQKWIFNGWNRFIDRCSKLSNPIIILDGDLGEGDYKDRSYQVITRNRANVKKMVVDLLDPLAQMGDVYVIRGTPAHTGKSGCLEEDIANDLGAVQSLPDVYSWYSLLLQVEGVRWDIAHECSMGGLPWTRPNAANKLAAQTLFDYSNRGERPPDIVMRAHAHRWGDSYDAYRTRALILPGWTLATEYINRRAPNSLAEIGGAIIHVDGDHYEVDHWKHEPERKRWVKA